MKASGRLVCADERIRRKLLDICQKLADFDEHENRKLKIEKLKISIENWKIWKFSLKIELLKLVTNISSNLYKNKINKVNFSVK